MFTRNNDKLMLSDAFYRFSKKLVQIILPALSSLYFGLDSIWDLPAEDKVVGTLAVLATFLGVSLGISTRQYESSGVGYGGSIVITKPEDGKKNFVLEIDGDPHEIEKHDSITFKVQDKT